MLIHSYYTSAVELLSSDVPASKMKKTPSRFVLSATKLT